MKFAIVLAAFVFSSVAMAEYVDCKASDFRAINSALKSRKLEKSPETRALIPAVQGLLAQESQIGVKCEKFIDLVPRPSIPGSVITEYRVSDASASFNLTITTNRVESNNHLTISKTR